jgi:hypothetical protein
MLAILTCTWNVQPFMRAIYVTHIIYVPSLCALKVTCLERLAWNDLWLNVFVHFRFNRAQSDFFQNNSVDIQHITKQLDTSLQKFVSV